MNLEENKFDVTNLEYLNSAGKLLFDLSKYGNTYEDFLFKKYKEGGDKVSLAIRKAKQDYKEFVNEILLKWSKVYLVDSGNYHWVMYKLMLYNREKYQIDIEKKYVSEGMRHATAIRKSGDEAYDKFREEINKHIIHIPTSGGQFMSPLKDFKKTKKNSSKLYYDTPDGEAEFFKAHYGGGSDALGY